MWANALLLLSVFAFASARTFNDPFVDIPFKRIKSSADRIRDHNYPAESHFVETSDNYVLNIFRIPYSHKLNNAHEERPAVLLQHGLFSCSDCWLLNGPDNALAFMLADAGFDVWLGNARGNIYSRNNTRLSVNHPYFWRFSWHEIGVIDLPTVIDYILTETGQTKLHYVGHSQGGTSFFVMGSARPEYNDKIKTAHTLAPAVFMAHTTHDLVKMFHPYVGTPGRGTALLSDMEFVPSNPVVQRALDTACGGDAAYPEYCRTLFMIWAGPEASNINATLLPLIAETHPAGISTNQGIHYIQLSISDHFRQFDHGVAGNLERYGQEDPPDYPLEKITSELYLYYGLDDTSVNYTDVERIPPLLPNLKHFFKVPDPSWGHIDFIFAQEVKETINDQVVQFCAEYEENSEEV